MNRNSFLLGLFSIGGQVLLLRELVSSLNGDELFIGTALFGWLLSVAMGAYLEGKAKSRSKPKVLFAIGAVFLPLTIIGIRLLPLMVTRIVGEVIPFSPAAFISVISVLPVSIISGMLFTSITSKGHRPAASIIQVYLFEGLGAFIGGLATIMLVGNIFSTLGMALSLGIIVVIANSFFYQGRRIILPAVAALICLVIIKYAIPPLDNYLDTVKYKSYRVKQSFDTPYGHQIILERDKAITLVSDNTVEATYPDLLTAENLLIPPLLYRPQGARILYIGRAELGIMQLADSVPGINLTALDARNMTGEALDKIIPFSKQITRIDDDPISFLSHSNPIRKYDIIIINSGEPDNYKNNRFLTDRFLNLSKTLLKNDGIIFFPSHYDTDRYISQDKAGIISAIYNTLQNSFAHVTVWPGDMTLFFASDSSLFNLTSDSLIGRIKNLGYYPQYINENYLADRLQNFKMEKLRDALDSFGQINTLNRPILVYRQTAYRAKLGGIDNKIIPALFNVAPWILLLPLSVISFFILTATGKGRRRNYGLFLYFVAGFVSLSMELIAFYLYQSMAGSLYSEMGVLIGAFMLGLAIGTYFSLRSDRERLEIPAFLLMLTALILFMVTYERIATGALIFYYILFLFTIAIATASLFVAATNRYYFGRAEINRGIGYAFEIIGSSLGALIPCTILLPLIGLPWILGAIMALIIVALAGAMISAG